MRPVIPTNGRLRRANRTPKRLCGTLKNGTSCALAQPCIIQRLRLLSVDIQVRETRCTAAGHNACEEVPRCSAGGRKTVRKSAAAIEGWFFYQDAASLWKWAR